MVLENIREKIDRLDLNLLDLMNQRASLALEIGEEKKRAGKQVLDQDREKYILDKLIENNQGPLTDESVSEIFRKIIEENRNLQQNPPGQ